MEELQLSNFIKVSDQLRQMKVTDNHGLIFSIVKAKTVNSNIWRLKKEGMEFTTRKHNDNLYVWRIK